MTPDELDRLDADARDDSKRAFDSATVRKLVWEVKKARAQLELQGHSPDCALVTLKTACDCGEDGGW